MRHRVTSWVKRSGFGPAIVALLAGWPLAACDDEPAGRPTGIRLTLAGCLDRSPSPDSCRNRLRAAAGESGACLVILPSEDVSRMGRLRMHWEGESLMPDPEATVSLEAGEPFTATLFLLTADSPGCESFANDTTCRPQTPCAVSYGPVDQFVASGETVIDFAPAGACAQGPAPFAEAGVHEEVCGDGVDNDCDGLNDEARVGMCSRGDGLCRVFGERSVCQGDRYVCDVVEPPRNAPISCNGIDEDCDGDAQEGDDCTECLFDNECLTNPGRQQCVDGLCLECDPANGDGCDPAGPRTICDAGACRGCAGDGECEAPLVCVDGRCRGCDPGRAGACPEPAASVCDAQSFECRACTLDAECPTGRCFNGRCGRCDPVDDTGCDGATPVCDPVDLLCRGCAVDAECPAGTPVCLDAQCVVCNPVDDGGCEDPARPICAAVDPGDPPSCGPCEQDDECATGQCRNGRCVGCDPTDNSGCDPLGGQPICDDEDGAENAFCRACRGDNECPGGLGRGVCDGGRCRGCAVGDARGCAEDGDAPICEGGTCRACLRDDECLLRPGGLDLCVGGRCEVCDPANDRGCDGAAPVCDGGDRCRACVADAECDGQQCVAGRCTLCDPEDDAGCPADRPICRADGSACEPCVADAQCPAGRLCVGGQCRRCDPSDDRGCDPLSPAPICDAARIECRGCDIRAADCAANRVCLPAGYCAECDPATNLGCMPGGGEPICGANRTCGPCPNDDACRAGGLGNVCDRGTGRCAECLVAGNVGCDDPSEPICEAGACRGCLGDVECPGDLLCRGGACVECTINEGCDPNGPEPVCEAGECRPCADDPECLNPLRAFCVAGTCRACDPDAGVESGCDLESDAPLCVGGVCVGCQERPAICGVIDARFPYCLPAGGCGSCDPTTHQGCDPNAGQPVCADGFNCRGCAVSDECALNPNGARCDAGRGRCGCNGDNDCGSEPTRPDCRGPGFDTCKACRGNFDCPGGTTCQGDGRCQ